MSETANGAVQGTGNRKFYQYDASEARAHSTHDLDDEEHGKLLEYVRNNVVGEGETFSSPFGDKRVLYCDFTASGRAVGYIEDYLMRKVLPMYGNTHTTTSVTGRRSTYYRHEARDLIKRACNGSEDDVLLFAGSGASAAVHKLIGGLDLHAIPESERGRRIIVFSGPFEHHSNILPWRDLGATVISIPESASGKTDVATLTESLRDATDGLSDEEKEQKILLGCFSAASNVTGILEDQDTISALLHSFGALAFWDFAAAGPYVKVDMNPIGTETASERHMVYKDAIFLSPHKFLGGVATPGVLVAKRNLFRAAKPKACGGGTVFFVQRTEHKYLTAVEEREEGGTPDIVGSIRCGLAFDLKERLGLEFIRKRETELARAFMDRFGTSGCSKVPGLHVLGPRDTERLPIFSFSIVHEPSKRLVHHNYVCALLNDLFGIQTRGGCACAGPYAQELMGMGPYLAKDFEKLLLQGSSNDDDLKGVLPRERDRLGAGNELFRPGFCRLNLHYTMTDETASFVMDALEWVAREAWKLMPLYKCNDDTGEWAHDRWSQQKERDWLQDIDFGNSDAFDAFGALYPGSEVTTPAKLSAEDLAVYRAHCLEQAQKLADGAKKQTRSQHHKRVIVPHDPEVEALRWFLYPAEAYLYLHGEAPATLAARECVFDFKVYPVSGNADIVGGMTNDGVTGDKMPESLTEVEAPAKAVYRFHAPSRGIWRTAVSAMVEFDMIRDGDRVLACLSGGKDSLSMLHILKQYQRFALSKGIRFELGAATVDPQIPLQFDPRPLIPYCKELGIPYFFESQGIMRMAKKIDGASDSICSFCSRMKRGVLYSCARREKYNVLAMGQHLDDMAESFFMSTFHNGLMRTMKAHYLNMEKDLRIIRPLAYVRERDLAAFAAKVKLPVIPENCPACFEEPKERHRIKQLLAAQERLFPPIFKSILTAIHPLMAISQTGMEASAEGRYSRRDNKKKGMLAALPADKLPPREFGGRMEGAPPLE